MTRARARARALFAATAAGLVAAAGAVGCSDPTSSDPPAGGGGTAPTSAGTGGAGGAGASTSSTPPAALPALDLVRVADLDAPTDAWALGGSLLVTERDGRVLELRPDGEQGYEVAGTVADLRSPVGDDDGERGLLGITADPAGTRIFVNHTAASDGSTVIEELALTGGPGALRATPTREVLRIAQPYANHNGGEVLWGPDGMLWVPTGDGGASGDPEGRAQRLDEPLGKLLRLHPDAAGNDVAADGNPYVDTEGADPLVWARGLRNPYRATFDEATGDLWLADVGQRRWEEVSVARAADGSGRGADFGWDRMEGTEEFEDPGPEDGWPDDDTPPVDPVHTYPHDGRCSVIGGVLYRGTAIPALQGRYLFTDYCDGVLRALDGSATGTDNASQDLGVAVDGPVSVNADESGEPVVLAPGGIWRLVVR